VNLGMPRAEQVMTQGRREVADDSLRKCGPIHLKVGVCRQYVRTVRVKGLPIVSRYCNMVGYWIVESGSLKHAGIQSGRSKTLRIVRARRGAGCVNGGGRDREWD